MTATPQASKLAELRAKTDREWVRIIGNALEVGLLLAANELDVDPAGVLHRRAADIYADRVMLVEKVEDVRERRRLKERLRRLRKGLEQLWRWVRGFESIKNKARTARLSCATLSSRSTDVDVSPGLIVRGVCARALVLPERIALVPHWTGFQEHATKKEK